MNKGNFTSLFPVQAAPSGEQKTSVAGGETTYSDIRVSLVGGEEFDPATLKTGEMSNELCPFFQQLYDHFPKNKQKHWTTFWDKAETHMSNTQTNGQSPNPKVSSNVKDQWEGMYRFFAHQTSKLAERMKSRVFPTMETQNPSTMSDSDWKELFEYKNGSFVDLYNDLISLLKEAEISNAQRVERKEKMSSN